MGFGKKFQEPLERVARSNIGIIGIGFIMARHHTKKYKRTNKTRRQTIRRSRRHRGGKLEKEAYNVYVMKSPLTVLLEKKVRDTHPDQPDYVSPDPQFITFSRTVDAVPTMNSVDEALALTLLGREKNIDEFPKFKKALRSQMIKKDS